MCVCVRWLVHVCVCCLHAAPCLCCDVSCIRGWCGHRSRGAYGQPVQARWPQWCISLGNSCLCAAERSLRKSTNKLTQRSICTELRHPVIRFWLCSRARCCSDLSSCWCSFLFLLLFSCLSSIPFIHHPCFFIDLPSLSFISDRQSDTQTEEKNTGHRDRCLQNACLLLIKPNGNMSVYVFIWSVDVCASRWGCVWPFVSMWRP